VGGAGGRRGGVAVVNRGNSLKKCGETRKRALSLRDGV